MAESFLVVANFWVLKLSMRKEYWMLSNGVSLMFLRLSSFSIFQMHPYSWHLMIGSLSRTMRFMGLSLRPDSRRDY